MAMTAERSAKLRKTITSSLIGAIVGAGSVSGLLWLAGPGLLDAMGISRIVLAAVGVIYLLLTAMIGFGLAAPRAGAKLLNVADADELVDERANLGMSAAFTALLGLTLILIALAPGPGFAEAIVPGAVAMAAVLLLFAAAILTWRWQQRYDELSQQLGLEGAGWALLLGWLILVPWATAAALGWAALGAIDVIAVLAATLLLGSFVAIAKRGMMVR